MGTCSLLMARLAGKGCCLDTLMQSVTPSWRRSRSLQAERAFPMNSEGVIPHSCSILEKQAQNVKILTQPANIQDQEQLAG